MTDDKLNESIITLNPPNILDISYQAYLASNSSANEVYFNSYLEKRIVTDQPKVAKLDQFTKA